MKARWMGENIGNGFEVIEAEPGNIGRGAENWHNYLLVCCPVCHRLHVVDERWKFDRRALTLTPSVKCEGHRGVCHWNLTNGEFIVHADSTAKPVKEQP